MNGKEETKQPESSRIEETKKCESGEIDCKSMPHFDLNDQNDTIFDQKALETANPSKNFYDSLDDLLDEDFHGFEGETVKSENNRAQGGYRKKLSRVQSLTFIQSHDFFQTCNDLPAFEKLVKDNPLENLMSERQKSPNVPKEEKAINTSQDKEPTGSDKVTDLVNCPICLDMIEDATETPCCHNIFCETCISKTDKCPICQSEYYAYQLTPNIPMRRLINEILMKCKNEGCETECTKANLEKHLEVCLYQEVFCPNSPECPKILRLDLENHTTKICEFRFVDCVLNCGVKIRTREMYDHIHNICSKSLIPCKNSCGEVIERGSMEAHTNSNCMNEIIFCQYKKTHVYHNGCDLKLKRSEMQEHLHECPFRIIKCQNEGCEQIIAFKDSKRHDVRCKFKVLQCRNECGEQFRRQFEDDHFDKCPLQMIRCPYFDMGCKTELLREENQEHLEKEAFNHSALFIEGQNKKNEEIRTLKNEMEEMKEEYSKKFKVLFEALNLDEEYVLDDFESED
ncbi:unnamed protein product [Moneuplotes crassus]|uniref:Uncharacterized protein n=1 Tax=Euplotes crassus TaxID=5936 RepID=A0AAD1U8S4_EUPCR|nr:unnamed protein product [Moneuplotes crassus]